MKQYETVIGLEVHVELATKTKIFCGCSTEFGGAPNTHTCPVCTGMPGSLPVLNKKVVEFALKAGLAANCQIHQYCKFDRKNYFYPDNPQNYQISQLYLPICHDGWVEIETSAGKKKIRIHEMHMEEDAGKLIHDEWEDCSLVDYNRSGVPLIEIVSEPDMRSSEEVIAYLEKLRCMMQYLGVSDCKLQEGSMRADVNLSVREVGAEEFGTRTEMKNLNSFKAIARAIEGERERQIELIEEGKAVTQETRRWDDNKEYSYAMRSKEDAKDYRYFPDPDLLPLEVSNEWIAKVKSEMPELPQEMRQRLMQEFGLSEYDAGILTGGRDIADYYVAVADAAADKKIAANWVMGEVAAALNQTEGLTFATAPVTPTLLAKLLGRIADGTISNKGARIVFQALWDGEGQDVDQLIDAKGLKQISDAGALEAIVDEVIAKNQKSVDEFRSGKEKALNALVGQCMKATKGKANPGQLNALLRKRIAG